MKFSALAAHLALAVTCVLATVAPAQAQFWQCAPFARSISGIDIRGNADTWWGQAAGHYARGTAPRAGAVLAFAATSRMRVGHVATVSRVISDREVLLTHANWSRPGQVETNVRAVDVSPEGDWSMVKVWYAPVGGLGTSANPARGFIYPSGSGEAVATVTLASRGDPRGIAALVAGLTPEG